MVSEVGLVEKGRGSSGESRQRRLAHPEAGGAETLVLLLRDAARRLGMPVSPELPPWEVFKRLVLEGEGLAVVRVDLGEPVLAYWAIFLPIDALLRRKRTPRTARWNEFRFLDGCSSSFPI